jgi:putative Holliday junction resolvase
MRILGIDYGTKRIGFALSDKSARLAFPHSVLEAKPGFASRIKKICEQNNISKIVLGRPVGYKGDSTIILKQIEKFKILLEKEVGLSVVYENEVLTTQQAKRLAKAGQPRGKISNYRSSTSIVREIDASAAAIILQTYLDKNI